MGPLREAASFVRPALTGAVAGAILYFAADTASDVYVFFAVRRAALERVRASADVAALVCGTGTGGSNNSNSSGSSNSSSTSDLQQQQQQQQQQLRVSPWYEGTLGFSHRDTVAHATFAVAGPAARTDIVARARRRPGPRVNFIYNSLGPGAWDLVACDAMFPGPRGLAQRRSLMPPPPAEGGGCAPCEAGKAQQQQQPAGTLGAEGAAKGAEPGGGK